MGEIEEAAGGFYRVPRAARIKRRGIFLLCATTRDRERERFISYPGGKGGWNYCVSLSFRRGCVWLIIQPARTAFISFSNRGDRLMAERERDAPRRE